MATEPLSITQSYDESTIATYTAKGFQRKDDAQLLVDIALEEVERWAVSLLEFKLFGHRSLLFESSRNTPFYVDLIPMEDEVTLQAKGVNLDDDRYKGLTKTYLGTVRKSASTILETAATALEQFGDFHYVRKNYQVSIQVHTYIHVCLHALRPGYNMCSYTLVC